MASILPCYWQHSMALILLVGTIWHGQAHLPEQPCPEPCNCNYHRINWATDCSNRALNNVPSYEHGLSPNVYKLNLNENNITETIAFPEGIKLRSLLLANNQLTTITRTSFYGLDYLLDLDLSNNQIVYIEPDALVESPGLITLTLRNNQLEKTEGPFLISKSLLHLDISDCQLNYLNPYFFTEIPSLNSIDLSGNPIEVIKPAIFQRITFLQTLKLNRCKLSTISSDVFNSLEDLKILELSDNYLKGPLDWTAILAPLARLETLVVRGSRISDRLLSDGLFDKNLRLKNLDLAENELSHVDLAKLFGNNLKNIDLLDLSMCRINGISANSFTNVTNLRKLNLTGNRISAEDITAALTPLTNLRKLSLTNCSLTRLPQNIFNRLTNLQELDLSMNLLNDGFIDHLIPLENLEYLDISFSNLEYIPRATFSKMASLKTLVLSGNPLQRLESGLFQNLISLKVLKLENCGMAGLKESVFQEKLTYSVLEELYFAGNPLKIPKKGLFLPLQLNQLKTLDLSDCNVMHIPPNALQSFGNITYLNLHGNQLSSEDENSLHFLENLPLLEKLDMSKNHLKLIAPFMFKKNVNLKWLKLDDNPWQCGCNIADMWEWSFTVKRDPSFLVGSTSAQARKRMKQSRTLSCEHDTKKTPIKARKLKHFTKQLNRTWSSYVSESNCDSSRRLLPAKFIGTKATAEALTQQKTLGSTPAWSSALILSLMLITVATMLVKS